MCIFFLIKYDSFVCKKDRNLSTSQFFFLNNYIIFTFLLYDRGRHIYLQKNLITILQQFIVKVQTQHININYIVCFTSNYYFFYIFYYSLTHKMIKRVYNLAILQLFNYLYRFLLL